MKNTMKKLAAAVGAVSICALLILAFATPGYADKACAASVNLKTCVSSLTLANVTFGGGTLTVPGVLKGLNSGNTDAHVLSVVANLQTKDKGSQYTTIATVTAPCGAGLLLDKSLPLTIPPGADVCGGANEGDIGFTAMFSGLALSSGTPARLELVVTYEGAPLGSAGELCGATPACPTNAINVRFGFVVP